MKTLKNQKGITLVALVITIIVLLILAGVSLSLVLGNNGILGRASNSSAVQKAAAARELVELDVADLASEYYAKKYVNNDNSVGNNVGAYISTSRTTTINYELKDGSHYSVAASKSTVGTKEGYVVTLTVLNGKGNTTGTCTGMIDDDGKWITPIDVSNIS